VEHGPTSYRLRFKPDHLKAATGTSTGGAIGEFSGNSATRSFAVLLIDEEEGPYLRAALVGMLREA